MNKESRPEVDLSGEGGISLSDAPQGARVRLLRVEGGHALRLRLAAMGLSPGVSIGILQNGGGGPALLAVRQSRIAVGRVVARAIRVCQHLAPRQAAKS